MTPALALLHLASNFVAVGMNRDALDTLAVALALENEENQ